MLPSEEKGNDEVELTVRDGDDTIDIDAIARDFAEETSRLIPESLPDNGVQKLDQIESGGPWWTYAVLAAAVSTGLCISSACSNANCCSALPFADANTMIRPTVFGGTSQVIAVSSAAVVFASMAEVLQ